ncbi:EmrB/QacA subfamily drug resistance transporter [Leucobacter exalbidus]|uniref:EmrB/QacA subfamily drug resistance transporter n=1 Tax=Leucobacter exalbidus TaxID=662960 RepID=A0A940PTX5_9MICO|nr:DHA2 family efflux MFS transporter permease subunit [Leucobacter exalbidus]MBP1325209.1 EmrB/QacA subfamily drug resistance transporter [Leucobacter exalbidus]
MTSSKNSVPGDGILTGRALNLALTGLFMSMFVSMVAMNVVGTSMPVIIADIGGSQASYTWVVMATSLASAIGTPIWGKLADLTSKKVLIQTALVIFTLGSIFSGMAHDPTWLISFRVLQGLGVGGLGALVQIVLAEIVSPRERGKYMGIMGAIMAVATVGGPLLGGLLTDTVGWRWNFYVAVPIAIVSIIMLQKTLHLNTAKRKIKIDYAGAVLISAGFSSLLIWITLGGSEFDWMSWQTFVMVGAGVLMLVAAVIVEMKVEEPLIPLTLFKNRTFTLASIASISVGVAMFATVVYLGQYMQLARGRSVIESSLLTLPMMGGLLGSSTLVGQIISRTGKWKRYMVIGGVCLVIGTVMMGQLRYDTDMWYVGVSMFILGCGVGMTMQNLVLIVQNTVAPTQMGAASSAVTFFRTIGGSVGMSIMGTVLAHKVMTFLNEGIAKLAQTHPMRLMALKRCRAVHCRRFLKLLSHCARWSKMPTVTPSVTCSSRSLPWRSSR